MRPLGPAAAARPDLARGRLAAVVHALCPGAYAQTLAQGSQDGRSTLVAPPMAWIRPSCPAAAAPAPDCHGSEGSVAHMPWLGTCEYRVLQWLTDHAAAPPAIRSVAGTRVIPWRPTAGR